MTKKTAKKETAKANSNKKGVQTMKAEQQIKDQEQQEQQQKKENPETVKTDRKAEFKKQCELWGEMTHASCNENFWKLFCNIITSNGEDRPALQYVYSDGEKLAATNGKILAVIEAEYPAGFYKPAMIGKGKNKQMIFVPAFCEHVYPNYKQVMVDTAEMDTLEVNFSKDTPLYPELFMMNYTLAMRGGGKVLLDEMIDYIVDTFGSYTLYFNDKNPVVTFTSEGITITTMGCTRGGKILETINQYKQIAAPAAVKAEPVKEESKIKKIKEKYTKKAK